MMTQLIDQIDNYLLPVLSEIVCNYYLSLDTINYLLIDALATNNISRIDSLLTNKIPQRKSNLSLIQMIEICHANSAWQSLQYLQALSWFPKDDKAIITALRGSIAIAPLDANYLKLVSATHSADDKQQILLKFSQCDPSEPHPQYVMTYLNDAKDASQLITVCLNQSYHSNKASTFWSMGYLYQLLKLLKPNDAISIVYHGLISKYLDLINSLKNNTPIRTVNKGISALLIERFNIYIKKCDKCNIDHMICHCAIAPSESITNKAKIGMLNIFTSYMQHIYGGTTLDRDKIELILVDELSFGSQLLHITKTIDSILAHLDTQWSVIVVESNNKIIKYYNIPLL